MSCSCLIPDKPLVLGIGTSPSWSIAVIDPENADAAVSLVGASLEFIVKESPADSDADAVFSLSSAEGEITITNAVGGLAQIDNTVAKSELLSPATWYYYYLRITLDGGEIRLAAKGPLEAIVA